VHYGLRHHYALKHVLIFKVIFDTSQDLVHFSEASHHPHVILAIALVVLLQVLEEVAGLPLAVSLRAPFLVSLTEELDRFLGLQSLGEFHLFSTVELGRLQSLH